MEGYSGRKGGFATGLIKRTVTGEDINIWDTNWLPRDGLLRPVTIVPSASTQGFPQQVGDLMNQATMTWDIELIQSVFLPMDAQAIVSIPLSTRRQTDFWAWHYECNGVFTVRSADRMLVDTRERRLVWLDELPAASNTKDQERAWTSLWKMKVPSKLTVFLWRLARQSLPTDDVLQHCNMAPQNACVVCGETDLCDIPSLSVTTQGVFGFWRRPRSVTMCNICMSHMLVDGWKRC
jgi:hypothetical protein